MPPGTSLECHSQAVSQQLLFFAVFGGIFLHNQLLNAAEAISAPSTRQMAPGTLHPSPMGLLCSPTHRSSPCGQWSRTQVTKRNQRVFEHMLYTLTSDGSIPLLAVTASSGTTGHTATSSLAPIQSDPHHTVFR